ncbi:MAG: M28 family peptidase [Candidatus Latescibacteria bacterium]|nr:M28 family peptidase [Candidatus Latescibacterota bacterium]
MKRRNFITITGKCACMLPIFSACSSTGLPNSRDLVSTTEKREQYLEKMLRAIVTDLGPRWVGTPAMKQGEQIIKKELEKACPNVVFDPITFENWELTSEPEFLAGDKRIEIYPSHGTGGTSPDGITGVLKKSETPQVAYDIINDSSGEILGRVTITPKVKAAPRPYWFYDKEHGGLPNVNIGKADIPVLENALAHKTPVRLNYQVRFTPDQTTSNVIGTLPGESSDEIVCYAHLDTVYNSPGANDNAASLVMVLMLAHAFSGTRPKKTLKFIATTGEEFGYLGTYHIAERRKNDGTLRNIKFIFDFDSVTWGPDMTLITQDEELVTMLQNIDNELNVAGTPQWRKSDGLGRETRPFKEAGLQARGIVVDSVPDNEINELCWHRPDDIAKYARFEPVDICWQLFYELLKRLQEL